MSDVMFDARLFDRLVAKTVRASGCDCLLWIGYKGKNGYGRTRYRGMTIDVHRALWISLHGDPPVGECVLHTCDVKHCLNDQHLFLGSNKDRFYRMLVAGKRRSGSGTYKPRKKKTVRRWFRKPVAADEMFVENKVPNA